MKKYMFAFFCSGLALAPAYGLDQTGVTVRTEATYFAARSLGGQPGRAELTETEADIGYGFRIKDRLPVKLSFQSGHIDIREGSALELPSHLEAQKIDIETTFPFPGIEKEGLYLRLGITPSFYSDDWDCASSSFRIPLRAAAIYQQSDKLTLVAGARLAFDREREAIPFLGAIYRPDSVWSIELIPPRPRAVYRLGDRASLYLEAEYSADEYEVSRGREEGLVLRSKGFDCGLGLAFEPGPDREITFSAGRALNHYLEYADGSGKVSFDDGWYLRLSAKLGF